MTTYPNEEYYLQDQVSSCLKAKKILKNYKDIISVELNHDYRGDRDKVLEAIDEGLKYLDSKRKKVKSELKDYQSQFKK